MKIYTRSGDEGQTGLQGGQRVAKDTPRIDAYGEVDELNSLLGVVRSGGVDAEVDASLARIQGELFRVGAELSSPGDGKSAAFAEVDGQAVSRLEAEIDRWDEELPPLRAFILPGGEPPAAMLHVARTVCRRAERRLTTLARAEEVRRQLRVYLNRLSDHLFVAARLVNHRKNRQDVEWKP